jgi:hypothetical protein
MLNKDQISKLMNNKKIKATVEANKKAAAAKVGLQL